MPFGSNRADHPLRECILPGTPGCADDFLHAQRLDSTPKLVAIGRIAVADQVPLGSLFREGFHHLLRGPFGVRMFRNSEMKHLPPLMLQHEKHEQNPQADSRYGEEVDGDDLPNVVL
jgi:hypothetical protein